MAKRREKACKHGSLHHLIPKSRGGPKESWNEKRKPPKKHRGWHTLFENLLPCEVLQNLYLYWDDLSWKKRPLTKKQKRAFENLLRESSTEELEEIIKEEWAPVGCFSFAECVKSFDVGDNLELKKKCPLIKLYEKERLK